MNNNTNNDHTDPIPSSDNNPESPQNLNNMDALSHYLKSVASTRQGRAIPPLENWHPESVADMDLVIKANGEWWHENGLMTRKSLVSLFATILCKEEQDGVVEYFLKTPVQKLRIEVEDTPLLINDVGIVTENNTSWLEFTTTTGDVVRLDDAHLITLRVYEPSLNDNQLNDKELHDSPTVVQVRPYIPVRNGLEALIGRNTFYHLTEIGKLIEQNGETVLTLQSGGQSYAISMPNS